jgi:hypothetical protein
MQSPEARIISQNPTGVFGYMLLIIFLVCIILITGYLVIERDDEKKQPLSDVEASDNRMYQKLD